MSTNQMKEILNEYLADCVDRMVRYMKNPHYREETPADLQDKFRLVCMDDNHDMSALRAERLRHYHDADRARELERLQYFAKCIPDGVAEDLARRIVSLTQQPTVSAESNDSVESDVPSAALIAEAVMNGEMDQEDIPSDKYAEVHSIVTGR